MTEDEEQRIVIAATVTGKWLALGAFVGVVAAHYLDRGIMAIVDSIIGGPLETIVDGIFAGLDWLASWIP